MKQVSIKIPTVLFILSVFLCTARPGLAESTPAQAPSPLVASELLSRAGLSSQWQITLPIEKEENLDRLFVFGRYLCVLTDRNYFFCIDRDKGSVEFGLRLAVPGLPVCRPCFYENKFYFLIGNQLQIIDPALRSVIKKKNFDAIGSGYGCGLAKNTKYLYLAGADNRLYAILLDDDILRFTATADNNSSINSVLATDNIVVFGTEQGNLVAMMPDQAVKIWQYDLSGPLDAPVVMDEAFVYAAGRDTKCCKLNASTGQPAWAAPFYAGQPLSTAPVIGKSAVYLFAGRNGLYAIDKQTGKELWNLPSGIAALCESKTKSYVFSGPGVLSIMDNTAGKELMSLNFNSVSRYAVNMTDPRMYLADQRGTVQEISVAQ